MEYMGSLTKRERRLFRELQAKKNGTGFEIEAEIFAVGLWNGMEFTTDDLKQIANAFHSLGENHAVPLKFGHNDDQPFTDGQPALGWVADVFVEGDTLKAKFVNVPEVVKNAIESRRYSKVSVELDMGVEHGGTHYPLVLSGVALLGADIPAVNTLEDLQAFMGRESVKGERRLNFIAIGTQAAIATELETDEMNDMEKLRAENAALKETARRHEAEDQKAHFSREREGVTARLETLVKTGQTTPAIRESLLAKFINDDTVIGQIKFAVEQLETQGPQQSRVFRHQSDQARSDSANNEEADKSPDQVLLHRVRKLRINEPRIDFSAATRRVMESDPQLAREYILSNGEMWR